MADWAAWMEEVLELVAMRVGSDTVGKIRSYPLNIRELRVVKTRSGALVAGGYFTRSGEIVNCSAKKLIHSRMAFENESEEIASAIVFLNLEAPKLGSALQDEQKAAATSLEYYGITKSVLERYLAEQKLSAELNTKLRDAIAAVIRIYTS